MVCSVNAMLRLRPAQMQLKMGAGPRSCWVQRICFQKYVLLLGLEEL